MVHLIASQCFDTAVILRPAAPGGALAPNRGREFLVSLVPKIAVATRYQLVVRKVPRHRRSLPPRIFGIARARHAGRIRHAGVAGIFLQGRFDTRHGSRSR